MASLCPIHARPGSRPGAVVVARSAPGRGAPGWLGRLVRGARVTVYESSQMARLEVDQAGHPVATTVAGGL